MRISTIPQPVAGSGAGREGKFLCGLVARHSTEEKSRITEAGQR